MRAALVSLFAAVLLVATPAARSTPDRPNDPAWPSEWGPALTRAPEVWQRGTGSAAVVIAVVDTGVAPVADLAGALVAGVDLLGGGVGQGGLAELGYHGTWVASIIAARGDNGRDAAGYCWACSIMPVRVADGSTPAEASRVARGITWAVDHGARIVNVSLAGEVPSADEEAAVAYAAAHDVLVVASAGNSGDDARHYPGAYASALAVAGTDEHDVLYPWATRGAWVPLAAPGCATVVDPNVGAAYGCGSSFAPAAVSGIAGLLLSFNPDLTAAQIAAALRSSAHAVEGIGGGRVDAAAAFTALALHATNVPSPARFPLAPATAAAPVEVSDLHGTLTGARSLSFVTGRGRVAVRLAVRPPARCALLLATGTAVVYASGEHGVVNLETSAAAGSKHLTISCAPARAVNYSLELERPVVP
ncbi:MAG TPA: S8 family serine peptidase [Gaiellaceae bacterium]